MRVVSRLFSRAVAAATQAQRWGILHIRTLFLELFEQLVVLAADLGPFGKLVLAAGGIELAADAHVLCLRLALLGGGLGRRNGEVVDGCPDLIFDVLAFCPCSLSVLASLSLRVRRTRLFSVVAPTRLMTCTATSTRKMTTKRDGILAGCRSGPGREAMTAFAGFRGLSELWEVRWSSGLELTHRSVIG